MPALSADHIKSIIDRFIPESIRKNPFVRALLAGGAAVAVLLATPAFAPIGVVGATGWIIVYIVTGGTFSMEIARKAWESWRAMSEAKREDIDNKLEKLKKAHDAGGLSDEAYKKKVKEVLDGVMK